MRDPKLLSGDFAPLREAFDAEHDQRYGQAAPDERLEIVNVRLVVTAARTDTLAERWLSEQWTPEPPVADQWRDVVFTDPAKPLRTRIVWRPSLPAGARIEGPAVIEEPNATTLIHPGDVATVSDAGHLIIDVSDVMTRNEAHPITVEVVRNAIVAYADEMANALSKAAYNMMIYEVRDYCCGLIDTQARMISQNRGGLPIFLADLGVAVADGIARYGLKGFAPGDVIIMNQGEVCGQHLNNVVLYSPCFHGDELVGFAANRAHWVDIGGVRQGFGSYGSSDIYAEGIQMRSLKIYEAGKRNETLWQIIRDNTRYPDAALGDMRAQIASCQLGARRYGRADRALRPRDGRGLHRQGLGPGRGRRARRGRENPRRRLRGRELPRQRRPHARQAAARQGQGQGARLADDGRFFSEMNPQVPGPLNSGRGGGIAGARVAFKALTSPDLDVNEGCFRPLEVVLPEGTMLSAKPPSALGLWSIALPTVIDTILKALAPAVPHLIPAAHKGDMGGCSFFGFRDDGSRFLLMNIFGGGWGGRPDEDGEDAAGLGLPGRRAQHAGRIAGDQVSGAGRDPRAARRFRRRGQASRRARRRADLSASAKVQGQHQPRPHPRSAVGPARRQVRRGQRMLYPSRRRHRNRGEESDRDRDRGRRPRRVPDRRRRRLRRSARSARPRRSRRTSPRAS